MFEKSVIDLPRTAPNDEPVSTELAENENLFESFNDELIDPEDSAPEIEILSQAKRGAAVRAPIYANPESRPERTLPKAAREQIESANAAAAVQADTQGVDPFQALLDKYGK